MELDSREGAMGRFSAQLPPLFPSSALLDLLLWESGTEPPRLQIFALLTSSKPPPHPHILSGSFQTTEINPSKDGQGSNLLTAVVECQPLGIVAPKAKGENI